MHIPVRDMSDGTNTAQLDKSVFSCWIETLQGDMAVSVDDYIIKGVKGQFYPCKPDIFAMTYELDKDYILVQLPGRTKPIFTELICDMMDGNKIVQALEDTYCQQFLYVTNARKTTYDGVPIYELQPYITMQVVKVLADVIAKNESARQQYFQKKGSAVKEYYDYLGLEATGIDWNKQIVQDIEVFLPIDSERELKKQFRDFYINLQMVKMGFDMDNIDQYYINLDSDHIGYTKQQITSYLSDKLQMPIIEQAITTMLEGKTE